MTLYEPLEPWEEEECLSRLSLVSEFSERMEAGARSNSRELKELSKRIFRPLTDPNGNEHRFGMKHFVWLLDFSMQKRIFQSESELEEARRMTSAYFNDGKPLTIVRWATMMTDVLESKELAQSAELN